MLDIINLFIVLLKLYLPFRIVDNNQEIHAWSQLKRKFLDKMFFFSSRIEYRLLVVLKKKTWRTTYTVAVAASDERQYTLLENYSQRMSDAAVCLYLILTYFITCTTSSILIANIRFTCIVTIKLKN